MKDAVYRVIAMRQRLRRDLLLLGAEPQNRDLKTDAVILKNRSSDIMLCQETESLSSTYTEVIPFYLSSSQHLRPCSHHWAHLANDHLKTKSEACCCA